MLAQRRYAASLPALSHPLQCRYHVLCHSCPAASNLKVNFEGIGNESLRASARSRTEGERTEEDELRAMGVPIGPR